MNETKRLKIKQTRKETRERRKTQVCKSYELKIDKSRLSGKTLENLHRMFDEGKWLYNHILGLDNYENMKNFDTSTDSVMVKTNKKKEPEMFERRELKVIPAQMKQEIRNNIIGSINNLSKLKKNGFRVGRLRFKSNKRTLPLNQYGKTHELFKDGKYVRIQGIKQRLKVYGIEQIPDGSEISKGFLIRKHGDFYVHVSCYLKLEPEENIKDRPDIGIDFGIKTQLTFSNGVKLEFKVPESPRTKKIQKRLSRSQKGSRNRWKLRIQLEKSYSKDNHRKYDIRNKTVSYLTHNYNHVAIQNDSVKGWQRLWGKSINNTALGSILCELKNRPQTSVVDRFFPSTKQCRICHYVNDIGLDKRMFHCENCGHTEDRDKHSANGILQKAYKDVPEGLREFKPVEKETSAMVDYFSTVSKFLSVNQETKVL